MTEMVERVEKATLAIAEASDYELRADLCHKYATAALEASGMVEEGWRDIASAPKDGTRVLVNDPANNNEVCFGSYDPDEERWGDDAASGFPIYPTHWRPLPEPPSLIQQRG